MRVLAAALGLALLLYPLAFYLLAERLGLAAVAVALAIVGLIRVLAAVSLGPAWRIAGAVGIGLFLAGVLYWQSPALLKLYPVAVNVGLLGYGLYTLWRPPSAIERLMHAFDVPVSAAGSRYTRVVTLVWCAFFAANGTLAAYTALAAPTAVWAAYNGAVSYAAAAVLFAAEYAVRIVYKRRVAAAGGHPRTDGP